ncbi:Mu transposase C-terminal domain-containing protein [Ralstonia pseudosolanacearum]|uniref:Mu transposase C-terminal domain-containing protein n=1 Tax=Ralstonia pseudosolanacearum TaxID=1310165 RepID=UPI00267660D5|nr:Mu transposase C-terminal domain-containing protein [Ralstonia pseudosolanacearum]MDO3506872.1 DDE-type integrase/transposase/recombinase [Ralstonia pseudosolanacearum]MDO3512918.1 DDE-type integrase/transposase/recombinase [Ralstonia pseudosolanacearum]MDO3536297.1 DDE-type integrase/transposase/recombinase [Ralstonia pseudosolanacearum]MDO3606772.1 DDE-type integrase/transposase/recombinase [Ralstonia pseudosolanacearum]MDO3613393.1 DDE-type integrase/transposase/recombinase [Ralstonia ps
MAGFALLKGTAFKLDGASFRIERMQPDGDLLLERLSDGAFTLMSRDRLLDDYAHGRLSFGYTPPGTEVSVTFSRALEDLPESMKTEAHRRWQYVQALLELGSFTFTLACLRPVITDVATRIGDPKPPAIATLYRWYSRYRSSRDTRALIPRTDRRGSSQPRQQHTILRLAALATEEAFRASPRATVENIYVRLRAKIDAENRLRMACDHLKPPSRRTVYRLVRRMDMHELLTLQEGRPAADRRLRLTGRGVATSNILERVEMDHTPLDLFLIDDKTWLPLGRPTLTVAIDHYSRMLLGYYLSYGDPSTAAVMGALRHAILPKQRAMASIPGLNVGHNWACYGVPDSLVVDNGQEFHGRDLEDVCFDLGMKIHFCPKRQPRFKGTVERYLKTVNHCLAQQLPGTSFSRFYLRGDYNPQQHAVLTLSEFIAVFEKWVLDVYAQQVHRSIGVTPWSRWHEGLKRREPGLPADVQDLQRRIGMVSERALSRSGILLNGVRYVGEELQTILSAYGEGVRVRVLFDPEDLGTIQVWGPDQERPFTILAVDQTYARGLTMRQNDLIRESLRREGASTEDSAALLRAKYELAAAVQELMGSRKQRQRRRAGAIKGLSSSRPQSDVVPPLASPPASLRQAKPVPPPDTRNDAPPARYGTFRVKRGGGP